MLCLAPTKHRYWWQPRPAARLVCIPSWPVVQAVWRSEARPAAPAPAPGRECGRAGRAGDGSTVLPPNAGPEPRVQAVVVRARPRYVTSCDQRNCRSNEGRVAPPPAHQPLVTQHTRHSVFCCQIEPVQWWIDLWLQAFTIFFQFRVF